MGRKKLIEDEALLDIARSVFIERGINVSTKVIAQRAGISEAVLYQRFTTKQDLLLAAMVPPPVDVEALFPENVGEDPVAALKRIATGALVYLRDLIPIFLSLMAQPSFQIEHLGHRHDQLPGSRIFAGLVSYLKKLQEAGKMGAADVEIVALTIFGTLHSIVEFELIGVHDAKFSEKKVGTLIETLWSGLAPN